MRLPVPLGDMFGEFSRMAATDGELLRTPLLGVALLLPAPALCIGDGMSLLGFMLGLGSDAFTSGLPSGDQSDPENVSLLLSSWVVSLASG